MTDTIIDGCAWGKRYACGCTIRDGRAACVLDRCPLHRELITDAGYIVRVEWERDMEAAGQLNVLEERR